MYRRLWVAQGSSNLGIWMHVVVAQWVVLQATGSPLLVSLVQAVTRFLWSYWRYSRASLRTFLIGAYSSSTAKAPCSSLAACSRSARASEVATPMRCSPLPVCSELVRHSSGPAWQSIQPELVPRQQLAQATALGAVNVNLARVFGPALGGVLVALAGASAAFALTAALLRPGGSRGDVLATDGTHRSGGP